MDLNEILSFKPEKPSLKRLPDGNVITSSRDSDMRPPQAKLPRGAGGGHNSHSGTEVDMSAVSDEEKLRILQSLEDEDDEEGEGVDASGVKRMLLSFEKKVLVHSACCTACCTIHVHVVCVYSM